MIKVDKEGKQLIDALVDCALKAGGKANLEFVNTVEKSIELVKTSEENKD